MPRLAIFTDLDGTLLDHDHYGFEPARSVIDRLLRRGDFVIPVTSKTAAEIEPLRRELRLDGPFVAENGCATRDPLGTLGEMWEQPGRCPSYLAITQLLRAERDRHGYRFRGFADMTRQEIAECTGLTEEDADRARTREASEPIVWADTSARLGELTSTLDSHRLRITEGGRFLHVLGPADKGAAVRALIARIRHVHSSARWLSVSLGDAPNDLPMLDAADIAVVVPSRRGFDLTPRAASVLRPAHPGPRGWAWAVTRVLTRHGGPHDG